MNFERGGNPRKKLGVGIPAQIEKLLPGVLVNDVLIIEGNVDLINKAVDYEELKKLLQNKKYVVKGNFYIDGNNLTSLEGCPTEVHGSFSCTGNPLETLKGLPDIIKGNVWIV